MKSYKIISLLVAVTLLGCACGAVTLSRVKINTFGSPQARILNNVIGETETAITGLETTPATASVTNGATLTATSNVYVVTGIGGANDTTNTISLANATDGQVLTLIVDGASTNLISIADSGNAKLSGAWLGDNNDSISLIGVSTNWIQTSESDN